MWLRLCTRYVDDLLPYEPLCSYWARGGQAFFIIFSTKINKNGACIQVANSILFIIVASLDVAKAVEVSDLGAADLKLQHITASINYLWSTTITDEVWMCEEPCNGTWEPVDGYLK